jgi:hypothetical protein
LARLGFSSYSSWPWSGPHTGREDVPASGLANPLADDVIATIILVRSGASGPATAPRSRSASVAISALPGCSCSCGTLASCDPAEHGASAARSRPWPDHLNGASSSGKSMMAKAVQEALPEPFLHVSPDHLVASGMLPAPRDPDGRSAGGSRCGRGSSMASTGACPRWRQRERPHRRAHHRVRRLARVPGHAARRPGCLPCRRALRSGPR